MKYMRYMIVFIRTDEDKDFIEKVCDPKEVMHTVLNNQLIYYITLPRVHDYKALTKLCVDKGIKSKFVQREMI